MKSYPASPGFCRQIVPVGLWLREVQNFAVSGELRGRQVICMTT